MTNKKSAYFVRFRDLTGLSSGPSGGSMTDRHVRSSRDGTAVSTIPANAQNSSGSRSVIGMNGTRTVFPFFSSFSSFPFPFYIFPTYQSSSSLTLFLFSFFFYFFNVIYQPIKIFIEMSIIKFIKFLFFFLCISEFE